mmetsp:Transcript_28433/g.62557  ORF Transcript_28433/g.62557 Transcript_28433/m.62557 type:complete len:142 (+) Transcript_28433:737-1162(+)
MSNQLPTNCLLQATVAATRALNATQLPSQLQPKQLLVYNRNTRRTQYVTLPPLLHLVMHPYSAQRSVTPQLHTYMLCMQFHHASTHRVSSHVPMQDLQDLQSSVQASRSKGGHRHPWLKQRDKTPDMRWVQTPTMTLTNPH